MVHPLQMAQGFKAQGKTFTGAGVYELGLAELTAFDGVTWSQATVTEFSGAFLKRLPPLENYL